MRPVRLVVESGVALLAGTSPQIVMDPAAGLRKSDDERTLARGRGHFFRKTVLIVLFELASSRRNAPAGQRRAGDYHARARREAPVGRRGQARRRGGVVEADGDARG